MAWPLSQDYNEAVQTPLQSFSDAELKQAEAKCNAIGIPMPCSGNFADVYEMTGPGGKKWAVKCFTRQVAGLRERYAAISAYLKQVNLPFMVDFAYLEQGVRIKGHWYPILKMDWVEGFVLNQLVKEHADNPPVLELLAQIWLRLAQRLREAKMAHADLQHGNVLLVPGSQARSLAVRLIDYDGMFVPALAGTQSGEVGHPAYQHPQRLRDGTYNAEVDRFPHLVIYTALRSLMVGGRYLWKKYDNGDNLLFRQADLNEPGKSALFAELMKLGDAELRKLVQTLAQSVPKPLEQTPLVEELAGGVAKRKSAVVPATVDATPGAIFAQAAASDVIRQQRPARRSYTGVVGAGVMAVVALAVGAIFLATHRTPRDTGPEVVVAAKNGPLDKKSPDSKKADLKGAPKVEPPIDVKLPPRIDPKVGPKTDPKEEPKIDPKPAPPPEVGPAPLSLQGHSGWVRSVAFSPDGKHIVSGSTDNTLKVWNAQTGQEERTLAGHTNAVWSVAYSPDGKRIISGSNDKTLKVWDAQSGKQLLSLPGNTAPLVCVAFSPDGKRIASGSTDNTLKVWNAQTGQIEHTLAAHGNRVASVAFSSDGKHIISGSADLTIGMWNAQTGQAEQTFKGHTKQVRGVAFSPDGKHIVSGSADSTLRVWNVETGQAERTLQGHTNEVHSVAFSPNGKHIVSGSEDKTVKVWDAQTGQVERTLAGHTERVGSVAFSPDGRRIVSGSNDQTVKVWTLPDAFAVRPEPKPQPTAERLQVDRLKRFVGHTGPIHCVAFSPNDRLIVSGSEDATVRVWDVATGKEQNRFVGHSGAVKAVAFSSDGKTVLSCALDKTIRIWDRSTKKPVRTFAVPIPQLTCVTFSRDGRLALCGGGDGLIAILDMASGKETRSWRNETRAAALCVAFSADSALALSTHVAGGVRLTSASTGTEILHLGGVKAMRAGALSDDGRRILSGGNNIILTVRDANTGKALHAMKGHAAPIRTVCFAPDSRHGLSGSEDRTIRLWNLEAGSEMLRMEGHTGDVLCLAVSQDGSRFLSGSADHSIQLWSLRSGTKSPVAPERSQSITNSIGMKLALIPPGKFLMGSPPTEKGRVANEDQHEVEITRPFYMGIHPVTVGQFRAFVQATSYQTEAEKSGKGGGGYDPATKRFIGLNPQFSWKNTGWVQSDEHPVVNVTWNDAVTFCDWLSRKEGQEYGLPTEAEWEHACRAGSETRFSFGIDENELALFAWYDLNSERQSHPVGQKKSNAFGLYDMHGNVFQWCSDWYAKDYYTGSPRQDPRGPAAGIFRVLRGGAFSVDALQCRSAYRGWGNLSRPYCYVGFRVVHVR